MAKFIAVYDGHTRKRLAYLQNAYDISYTKNTATLWTGGNSPSRTLTLKPNIVNRSI